MHYIKAKSILSPNGGMNLYRGCSHGCIYCDSRSRIYNMDHDFEDIAVKENAIELLQKTLKGKREKCMIGTGSMTDPYIPLEKDLKYIKKMVELRKMDPDELDEQDELTRMYRDALGI